ncbi:MAG: peptide chain release factor N(5)-glutamine methyltransferase [Dehalococcoidales bacterium]|nr:peptide chain release factor N(5)-glutamine methyltransferase [Dehalococcoidales bacterium]
MIHRDCLNQTRNVLSGSNIDDASLESELLVRHVTGHSRVQLYQNLEVELPEDVWERLQQVISRRLQGEPSAYITGNREFYGLDFYVNRNVLIPRPETEHLVDKALELGRSYTRPIIADIGTGSGAIAVSLAVNLPKAEIIATDISFEALKTADINCHRHNVNDRITLLCGNLLEPLPQKADIITANLPYVKKEDIPQGSCEPRLALDGGEDGLDIIRLLCSQVENRINTGGYLLLEIGLGQKNAVVDLLKGIASVKDVEVIPDLSGIDRIVCASFR